MEISTTFGRNTNWVDEKSNKIQMPYQSSHFDAMPIYSERDFYLNRPLDTYKRRLHKTHSPVAKQQKPSFQTTNSVSGIQSRPISDRTCIVNPFVLCNNSAAMKNESIQFTTAGNFPVHDDPMQNAINQNVNPSNLGLPLCSTTSSSSISVVDLNDSECHCPSHVLKNENMLDFRMMAEDAKMEIDILLGGLADDSLDDQQDLQWNLTSTHKNSLAGNLVKQSHSFQPQIPNESSSKNNDELLDITIIDLTEDLDDEDEYTTNESKGDRKMEDTENQDLVCIVCEKYRSDIPIQQCDICSYSFHRVCAMETVHDSDDTISCPNCLGEESDMDDLVDDTDLTEEHWDYYNRTFQPLRESVETYFSDPKAKDVQASFRELVTSTDDKEFERITLEIERNHKDPNTRHMYSLGFADSLNERSSKLFDHFVLRQNELVQQRKLLQAASSSEKNTKVNEEINCQEMIQQSNCQEMNQQSNCQEMNQQRNCQEINQQSNCQEINQQSNCQKTNEESGH